jgi:signal transduction histidine kinase/CheY-like chemotaxis protein
VPDDTRGGGRRRPGKRAASKSPARARRTKVPDTAAVGRLKRKLEAARRLLARREHLFEELSIHREELQAQNDALLRAERDLWATRDRLSDLFERAPLPYLTLNAAAVIAQANQEAARLLTRHQQEVVGRPFASFVAASDRPRFRQHIAGCRRQRGTLVVRLNLSLPDGLMPVNLSSTLTNDDWIYTAVVDLRDREQAEQERHALTVKAEAARAASEAKDQFLATLSHELRTPLTPVVAAMSAIERICGELKVPTGNLFAVIRRNIGFEVHLIDDLLDVTRLTHGKMTLELRAVDVHTVVNEAVDQLRGDAEQKTVQIQLRLSASRALVRGDADRLRQVFANLLRNAIKFTPNGGEIVVLSQNQGEDVVVAVRDTGPGLAEEERERIFDRFVQGSAARPREGLGLGLPIAHGIVTAHGGKIGVSSPGPGLGSTFEVRLQYMTGDREPIARPRAPRATKPVRPPTAGKARILFVEDHEDTARMMANVLEKSGYQVTVAGSVSSALAHLDEAIDVIVSDIGLPDGSGLDVMRQALSRRGPLPGIALSGYGTREDIRRSHAAGFKQHLVKPVDVAELLQAIEEVRGPRRAVNGN